MLFLKAFKSIALAILFMPLTGVAIATGLIFGSLLKAVSNAPELEEQLFNYASLGFAFVETSSFLLFIVAAVIIVF
jgi:F0F1-type ATP synthase membrane subunit c/vacuolar-type H+-ATPase subunit K